MFDIIFIAHIILCVLLIGLVLIQQGKGAEAGAIMGGGTDSVFGAGSAGTVVSKLTTGLAIAFMITSIILVKQYQTRSFVRQNNTDVLQGSVMQEGLKVSPNEVTNQENEETVGALAKEATEEAEKKTDAEKAPPAPVEAKETKKVEEASKETK
jgi:preprotein translocase subunit SecG